MNEHLINKLVTEIIKRLVVKLGGDGSTGKILSVCSGCSGEAERVAAQLKKLVLAGYELNLFFSAAAEATYRKTVVQCLDGFPHVRMLERSECYVALEETDAVIVPVASISTLSKMSMLVADTLHSQLLLNAMTMGKMLIIAENGAFPSLNSSKMMNANLVTALHERLGKIRSYGAVTCSLEALSANVKAQTGQQKMVLSSTLATDDKHASSSKTNRRHKYIKDKVLTASHVNFAVRGGFNILHRPDAIVTPMAKDLARQKRIVLSTEVRNL